ncbi:hypothetical protein [Legionella cardiaca]|uniref:Oxidoreductase n=1 Tax=Legionella cardiaca TaxID=1071983 RepID=A0ABY8AP80_9GAMM|nr:hypothetical protein [Legionella cardiaca]WED42514.1 hypothetical protein PXX05_11390 [Legionella cardiaca]
MLVSRVHEFIKAIISIEHKLGKVDKKLLHDLQEKYPLFNDKISLNTSLHAPSETLSADELQWLQEHFAQRWQELADSPIDYTFDPREVNTPWVTLAKELGDELKKPYLMILMPTLLNDSDPDMLSCHLEQNQDPRSIYLSDDGKTWHRVQGLFERLQQPLAVFSTYDQKKIQPRALTLREMFRIRSKKGDELAKEIDHETYANFWDYVIRRVTPTWQKKGKLPEHLLSHLLEMVELYFNAKATNGNLDEFKKKLKILASDLERCSLEDINHFYGIEIYGKQHNHYLVDILLDCLEDSADLADKLADVARWLCRFDPTLISKCKNLVPVYETLKVGEYFDASHLRQLITKLDVGVIEIKPKIQELLEKIPEKGEITAEIIDEIKRIYALRWQYVKDKADDYLRKPNETNRSWIRLAQYLAGAGYVEANYYKLLIPTLIHNNDPITLESVTNYPLTHFILSEDERELIYLPNCISQHQSNGTFYYFSIANRFRMLSTKELERLPFAAPQFYEYYAQVVTTEEENLPLTKETIVAIKDLVNGTLNPMALRLTHKITGEQEKIAEQAYIKFLDFVSQLPSDEAARLYAHTVVWRGQKKRFSELMDDVQLNETPVETKTNKTEERTATKPIFEVLKVGEHYESAHLQKVISELDPGITEISLKIQEFLKKIPENGEVTAEIINEIKNLYALCGYKAEPPRQRECIAVIGQFLAKLVLDYDPKTRFRPGIEETSLAALDEMRLCSAKQVFRDWEYVTEEEATRRALTVIVSLMTHNFSYVWGTGVPLHLWDQTNTTTATGKELFNSLEFALEQEDLSKIRFIYTYVMNNIVEKALAQKDIIKKCTRYEDTLSWLKTIKDESMFKLENRTCFDPKFLFIELAASAKKYSSKSKTLIDGFMEQLIRTLMQPETEHVKWIRINIEFNKLLNNKNFIAKDRKILLNHLRSSPQLVDEGNFITSFANFLIHRLTVINVRANNKKQGLFGVDPGQYKLNYSQIKECFDKRVQPSLTTESINKLTMVDVIAQLKEAGKNLAGGQVTTTKYLDSMSRRIHPSKSDYELQHSEPQTYSLM